MQYSKFPSYFFCTYRYANHRRHHAMLKILYPLRFPLNKNNREIRSQQINTNNRSSHSYIDQRLWWWRQMAYYIHYIANLMYVSAKNRIGEKKTHHTRGSKTKKSIPTIWTRKCVAFFALIKIINNRSTLRRVVYR